MLRKTGTDSQSHSTGLENSQIASSDLTTSLRGSIDDTLQLFKSKWLSVGVDLQLGVASDLRKKFSLSMSTLRERRPENIQCESFVNRFRERSRYSSCCKSRAQFLLTEVRLQFRRMTMRLFLLAGILVKLTRFALSDYRHKFLYPMSCPRNTSLPICPSGLKDPFIARAAVENRGNSFKFELVTAIL